jgi:hypothetical protein
MDRGLEEPVARVTPPAPTRPDLTPERGTLSGLAITSILLPLLFPFSSVVVASNPNGAVGLVADQNAVEGIAGE